MSSTDDQKERGKNKVVDPENLPEIPETKVQGILQELEILALHKGKSSGIDLSRLSPEQMDKLLEILSKNEDNAFQFHTTRLKVAKEIELKRIEATTVNQKTVRVSVVGLLLVLPLLTIPILFFKDDFFVPWLTFLRG